MVSFILILSLFFQMLAIYFSLSLIRLTGRKSPWSFIAGGIALMAVRRAMTLDDIFISGEEISGEALVELIGLSTSSLMAIGIARIRPVFQSIRAISDRLRESEEKYRSVVDSMAEGLVLQDGDGRIIAANPAAERILGRDKKELIGMSSHDPSWQAIHEDSTSFHGNDHPITVALKSGESQRNVVMGVQQPRGSLRWISINSGPILDNETGTLKAAVVTFHDITERLHAEKQQKDLQQQLQQTQKMESIGRLAGGLAHDFNNMLGAIMGFAEMAQKQALPEQKLLSRHLHQVQKAARHSADLTRQLLAFARKQPTLPQSVDLNQSVEEMQSILQPMVGENVKLTWSPGKNIWPVIVDPSQLDQILTNLCVNARDAITVSGMIKIETANKPYDPDNPKARTGDYVRLSVHDNGCGMDEDTVAKIFEPFYTTKGLGDGTGLGLATVYGIVEQNEGYIEVDSKIGRGTTFDIYLPRCLSETKKSPKVSPATRLLPGQELILLVEDEGAILEVVQMALAECGYTVLATQSPVEAMRIAKEHSDEISMLITDIIMPDIDGRKLAESLQAITPRMRCLYMSGYPGDAISSQGILDQGSHFINKPFSIAELTAKVREVLDE